MRKQNAEPYIVVQLTAALSRTIFAVTWHAWLLAMFGAPEQFDSFAPFFIQRQIVAVASACQCKQAVKTADIHVSRQTHFACKACIQHIFCGGNLTFVVA